MLVLKFHGSQKEFRPLDVKYIWFSNVMSYIHETLSCFTSHICVWVTNSEHLKNKSLTGDLNQLKFQYSYMRLVISFMHSFYRYIIIPSFESAYLMKSHFKKWINWLPLWPKKIINMFWLIGCWTFHFITPVLFSTVRN